MSWLFLLFSRRGFAASGTRGGHLGGHRLPLLLAIVGPSPCHDVGQQVVETLKPALRGMARFQLCGRFAAVPEGQPAKSRLPGRPGRLLVAYLATCCAQ